MGMSERNDNSNTPPSGRVSEEKKGRGKEREERKKIRISKVLILNCHDDEERA
jgi:hypothetical protein